MEQKSKIADKKTKFTQLTAIFIKDAFCSVHLFATVILNMTQSLMVMMRLRKDWQCELL